MTQGEKTFVFSSFRIPHLPVFRNAVVVVVDRLGAGFLGPYGATWLDTPGWNRLASQSLLIEHALSESPDLATVYRSLWTGQHALTPAEDSPSLAQLAAAADCRTLLATDEATVAEHSLAIGFGESLRIPRRESDRAAARVEKTQLARVFMTAAETLNRIDPPFLLWVHAQGMEGAWDAPWELRAQFADEDDPAPPEWTAPPVRLLPEEPDPDEMLGMLHAYAGQVAALDACIESFLIDFLESRHAETTLLALTSPRGYPLGEHRRVGPVDNALHGELLRTPLLLRFPDGAGAACRAQAIAQPSDVFATLADWLQLSPPPSVWGRSLVPLTEGDAWPRDRAVAAHGRERAIRTPAWFLRCPERNGDVDHGGVGAAEQTPHAELYVKPDDQWEANEISDRLPDVTAELTAAIVNFEQAVEKNDPSHLTPLSDALTEGVA